MGAAPSREAEESYLQELKSRRSKAWRAERRRKEVSLLPLTKTFMHFVQPSSPTQPNSSSSPRSAGRRSKGDGSAGGTSGSSHRNFLPAQRCDDVPPSALPFMQQLYSAYREPSTQFYCRKETWGPVNRLPDDLFYPTLESFYNATVACYDTEVYESNNAMQQVLEDYLMKERIQTMEGEAPREKGAEPTRRARKVRKAPRLRPTPCAICFEYPTCTIAPPVTSATGEGADATPSAPPPSNRSGAPHGSVVFAPYCSFMVIGFVGLVPVRHSKKATASAFLRPPADSAGDEGEGVTASAVEGGAEYELVAFVAKSAGEQHLGRALFQAAFLFTEQCRRAGLLTVPVPSARFSCFLTDVPSLCFLREVRLRCAEANWPRRLAQALRQVRLAGRHLSLEMDRTLASDLCAFMAECYETLDFHPPPASAACLFFGFVGDAGAQVLPSSALSPSIAAAALPESGSEAVRRVLQDKAERDAVLSRGEVLSGNSGSNGTGATGGTTSKSGVNGTEGSAGADAAVRLYCVVGTNRLTVGSTIYPHGTVLEQTVDVATGEFVKPTWTVAEDRTGQEKPPFDLATAASSERDQNNSMLVVEGDAADNEPRPALATSDVLLSWSKDLYLHARVADAQDTRWVAGYPQDYYTRAGKRTAEQTAALLPPQPSSTQKLSTTAPSDKAAADKTFFLWEFEHQGRTYTVGLVPNFVRAQQRQQCEPALRRSSSFRNNSSNCGRRSKASVTTDDRVDPTSASHISSSASQSARSLSAHSSDRSGRSADTYRTAGSSHSTLSNFAMTQGRRSTRQRRYVLSLGTDTVYENGAPVSCHIPRLGSDSQPFRTASDDGRGFNGSSYNDLGGEEFFNAEAPAAAEALLSNSEGSLSRLGATTEPAHVLPSQDSQLSSSVTCHSPYTFSTQPLQRRLSGGVSQGMHAAHQHQQQQQQRYSERTGGLLDSLCGSGRGGEKGKSVCPASHTPQPPFSPPSIAAQGVSAFTASAHPQTQYVREAPQEAARRGIYGPSQALAVSQLHQSGSVPPSTVPSDITRSAPPVMSAAGNVRSTHRGVDGAAEFRWDWRGAARRKE